jgi:hypothetical protein
MCFCKNVFCSANVLPLSACFLICVLCWHVRFYPRIKSRWCDWKKTVHTVISQWKTQRVYSFSAVFTTYSCSRPAVARKRKKAEEQESAGQWQRACSEHLTICHVDLFWREAFRVLQLVNTPDIYEENKYQRRNLLLYHCLLERVCKNSTYLNRDSQCKTDSPELEDPLQRRCWLRRATWAPRCRYSGRSAGYAVKSLIVQKKQSNLLKRSWNGPCLYISSLCSMH